MIFLYNKNALRSLFICITYIYEYALGRVKGCI